MTGRVSKTREGTPYYLAACMIPYLNDEYEGLHGSWLDCGECDGSGGYETGSNEDGSGGRPDFYTGNVWEDMGEHSYGIPARRSFLL